MLALTDSQILDLLRPAALVEVAEAAARAAESVEAIAPERVHLDWQDNTLLVMPAFAGGALGIKLVSVVPGNAARAQPAIQGVMILSDAQSGTPLAILNAAGLTALRTGAVGALGLKYITPGYVSSIGVVGCGVQGTWQAIFACSVRPVKEIFCVSRSAARIESFIENLNHHVPAAQVIICHSVEDLLDRTDVIITATNSSEPVLPNDPGKIAGKHFLSIGSFKPTMQELPDAIYKVAGDLVIDSEAARHEVGDIINPLNSGILDRQKIFTLGKLIIGQRTIDPSRTTVFKSVGMAIYDLYIARALYREACRRGIGQKVEI